MSHRCSDYRSLAFERVGRAEGLDELRRGLACEPCRRWSDSLAARVDALQRLPRLSAPGRLDELVRAGLRPDGRAPDAEAPDANSRSGPALRSLPRRPVPDELEARVAGDLAPRRTAAVAGLPRVAAPAVLERLVREELADPAAARTRRFVGDLPSLRAPVPIRPLARARRWSARAALAAAAAALVLWIATDRRDEGERYSFSVVRVDSAAPLDPMARALLGGFTGGLPSSEEGPWW